MINDNTPPRASMIAARRRLRDWAEGKPEPVRNLAGIVCMQICVLSRTPDSPALRAIVGQNLKRLAGHQPTRQAGRS